MWKFPVNLEIAVNAILYLCEKAKEGGEKVSFMKVVKLLFYCDKFHLKKYGRPITGDTYIKMDHGPNPSNIYDYLKNVRDNPKHADGYFEVEFMDNAPHKPIPLIIPLKESDTTIFSESDMEILDQVFENYGNKSAGELRSLSHKEKAWIEADFEMAYEDFLDPEDEEMKNYITEAQSSWENISTNP